MPLTGVFGRLADHHRELAALLLRARHLADKRADLWPRIRIELLSHERAETRALYPLLSTHAETSAFAVQHAAEVKDLEMMVRELDALPASDADWQERFDVLADTVVRHAEEEEASVFPLAQAILGAALAQELGPKFLRAKHQLADQL